MATVVVIYYLLFLPGAIENFIHYEVKVKFYVSRIFNFLFFTNALINPFIYAGQSREFNAAYRRILRLRTKYRLNLNTVRRTNKRKKKLIPTISSNVVPPINSWSIPFVFNSMPFFKYRAFCIAFTPKTELNSHLKDKNVQPGENIQLSAWRLKWSFDCNYQCRYSLH